MNRSNARQRAETAPPRSTRAGGWTLSSRIAMMCGAFLLALATATLAQEPGRSLPSPFAPAAPAPSTGVPLPPIDPVMRSPSLSPFAPAPIVAVRGDQPEVPPKQPMPLPQPMPVPVTGTPPAPVTVPLQQPQRLPALVPIPPGVLGMPEGSPASQEKISANVDRFIDPEASLDVIVGRPRIIVLKNAPKRVQVGQEAILDTAVITPTELALQGKEVGTTVLNLWFGEKDKQTVLTYLVRVLPDPEAKERLDRVYKALEGEVNRFFPRSRIELTMLGDKLVISGTAHDVAEGTQILRIVRANAPGSPASKAPIAPPGSRLPTTPDGTLPITPDQFETAGGPSVINLLKVTGEQQIALRVTVAEVNRSAARSIGLNFNVNRNNGVTVFSNNTGSIGAGASVFGAAGGLLGGGNITANVDGGSVFLFISALHNLSYAKSLAEPTLVTMNGQSATFQAGGSFPVPVVTGNTFSGLQGVQFIPYGVQVSFTPYITDRDRIRLSVQANVSARDIASGANIGGAAVSGLTTRNFTTTVELRQGETLAVAGLIQTNMGTDSTRLPFLGELPFIGQLTGSSKTSAGEQELVILITPELTHPMCADQVPPLPGSDLFEPTDCEFYIMGRLESHMPAEYRSVIRNDLSRVLRYRGIEKKHISGECGYTAP